MLTHQFREFGDRRVWTNPVDALVHCIFDFHGRPPLLKLVYQPRFPSPFDYTTDRILWHGPQHHRTQEFFLSRIAFGLGDVAQRERKTTQRKIIAAGSNRGEFVLGQVLLTLL
jgi:hypothetical protein